MASTCSAAKIDSMKFLETAAQVRNALVSVAKTLERGAYWRRWGQRRCLTRVREEGRLPFCESG